MADKLVVFKEHDVAALKEMVKWWRTFTHRDTEEQADNQHQSPETYIALAPGAGIPANTGSGASGNIPGSAVCDVYQINIYGELTGITGLSKQVYNLSTTATPSGWIPVTRDKFGKWIALSGAINGGVLVTTAVYTANNSIGIGSDSQGNSYSFQTSIGDIDGGLKVWIAWNNVDTRWEAVNWTNDRQSFLGTAQQYITSGSFGWVSAPAGTAGVESGTASHTGGVFANAAFGNVQHGATCWCEWDDVQKLFVITQIACPTGTATSHI